MLGYKSFILRIALLPAVLFINTIVKGNNIDITRTSEILSELPIEIKMQINDLGRNYETTMILDAKNVIENRSISVRLDSQKNIQHIGLQLIIAGREDPMKEVYDYIERTLLYIVLIKDQDRISSLVRNEKLNFKQNGLKLPTSKISQVLSLLPVLQQVEFTIDHNDEYFIATWKASEKNIFQISFPNNYLTICGKLKDEIEFNISEDLKKCSKQSFQDPDSNNGKPERLKENIYVSKGEFFLSDSLINSNTYFFEDKYVGYVPVFHRNYFVESVSNLFQNKISTNQMLIINHKLYGDREIKYSLKLNLFLDFFADNYSIYLGWQNQTQDEMKVSLFMKNKIFNYIHLLVIGSNSELIFDKNSELVGTFYTYIQQNF